MIFRRRNNRKLNGSFELIGAKLANFYLKEFNMLLLILALFMMEEFYKILSHFKKVYFKFPDAIFLF